MTNRRNETNTGRLVDGDFIFPRSSSGVQSTRRDRSEIVVNTLQDFFDRYVTFLGVGGYNEPILLNSENSEYNPDLWTNFLRLHDSYNQTRRIYGQFRERYANHHGPFTIQESRRLSNTLCRIQLGDIDNLFDPLHKAPTTITSRPCSRVYYRIVSSAKERYENRLRDLVIHSYEQSNLGHRADLRIPSEGNTTYYNYYPPNSLWEMHLQPQQFFNAITNLLGYESLSEYLGENVSLNEYVHIKSNGETILRKFRPNAIKSIPRRYRNGDYDVIAIPSLRRILSSLPEQFNPSIVHGEGQRNFLNTLNANIPYHGYIRPLEFSTISNSLHSALIDRPLTGLPREFPRFPTYPTVLEMGIS